MSKPVITNYRWVICALLFFATTINYIDRQIIGLLKPTLEAAFKWTESDYGYIVAAFTTCYALGYVVFGGFIDRIGSKIGYSISIVVWSIAAMLHAIVNTTFGFGAVRSLLGLGEGGNFPAAVKATAEWFPKKERALATGIFNSGTSVGAVIAPILVPLILAIYGWRLAFLITGAIGFVWLVLWLIFYEIPSRQRRLSKEEFDYIHSDNEPGDGENEKPVKWSKLLSVKQSWVFISAKALTDPVWWFFLFWLPSYFASVYHLDLKKPSLELVAIYGATTIGSIGGGYLSSALIKRGWLVLKARKTTLLIAAIVVLPIVLVRYTTNIWIAVAVIGLVMAAHQAWSSNIFTVVSDIVPKKAVSSVVGMGGMTGSLASALFQLFVGVLLDHYVTLGNIGAGYNIIFIMCALAYSISWLIIHRLTSTMKPLNL
ncbi:MFS transporter [Mucilaginibacter sp.]|uniref:MFS transporter n=1 Tax=Mucilaginibacter sp. TaxID=1882438 RepID=UPI002611EB4F|nr:MFS transporter [Mucilaginibacter sp.]MDB4925907.1 major facilitator superfamily 1 [Mucilaginibacter sp.]